MSCPCKERKVLFRGIKFGGGAPKSSYQYLNILKKDGYAVHAFSQEVEESLKETYEQAFDRIYLKEYPGDLWDNRDFLGLYQLLFSEYKNLKKEKPDLVIILGYFNAFFYTRFCNSLGIPAITLIAGGDLSKGINLLKDCPCDHVICFSEENRDVLLSCIDDKKITVIANRIQLKTVFNDAEQHYNLSSEDSVNVLFTSRISSDKYDSVTGFISLADKASDNKRKINLAIAGNGDCMDKLKEYVAGINNPCLNIELKGHVDNLIPEFEKAHIVVGKGRSVIEPIMMNRIGCVMGNDGKIEVCKTDNFEHLYHYNFSGRNLNCNNPEAVLEDLIDSILSGTFDTEEMKAAAEVTRKYYSSEYLADKFHYVLDNMECEKQRKKRVSVLWLVLKLFWIKLNDKIRKGKAK